MRLLNPPCPSTAPVRVGEPSKVTQAKRTFGTLRTAVRTTPQGFALVVTLSLMVLLSILAVSLLSLASVSLRASSGSGDMQTARANARMAMMIAIGELQKFIGPDQRITAPADLKNPTAGMPQWVGVYGNSSQANYNDAPSGSDKDLYKPTLLSWLVSGNENISFEFSKAVADFGKITTPPAAIPFNPTDPVGNIADATANSSNLTINGTKAALLVGPNSTGPYDPVRRQFVAAPVVPTKNSENQVSGGYAYWVGDEGTKARINLQDNYRLAETEVENAKSFSMVSQRFGIESMRRDFTDTSRIGSDYDPDSALIGNLVSTGEFPLLNSAALSSVLQARFHDLTAYSSSVLVDSYAGGLKRNFSAAIQGTGPADSDFIFKPVKTSDFGVPTWNLLRSWAGYKAARNSPAYPAAITPKPYDPATQTVGFGPVISTSVIGIGLEKGDTDNSLRIQIYPTLVLWNPHAAPIAAATYEIGMAERKGGTVKIQFTNKDGQKKDLGYFSLSRGDRPTILPEPNADVAAEDAASGNGFFRFRVEGSEIPPGESHIYTLDPSQDRSAYDPNGGSTLVRAASSLPLGTTRYLTGPSFTYPEADYQDGASDVEVRLTTLNTGMSVGGTDGHANNLKGLVGDRFEAVLTSPGALSGGFDVDTPIYQAVLDACPTCYLHGPTNLQDYTIYLKDYKDGSRGYAPIFAIRTQMVMEGHNDNSSGNRVAPMANQGANRWIATANPLAPYTKRTRAEYKYNGGNPVHGAAIVNTENHSFNEFLGASPGFTPAYKSGIGVDQSGGGGQNPVIFRDVLPDDLPLLSLGQLQHAPLSLYGFSPAYSFGNSKSDMRFKGSRDRTYLANYVSPPGASSPTKYLDNLYDMPWHLNRALWDRYFVSSVPDDLTQSDLDEGKPLPNARMVYSSANGESPSVESLRSDSSAALTEAAANLMVAGGFNINSTSVDAWRAVLTGTNKVSPTGKFTHPSYQSTLGLNAMMPRFARDVRITDSANFKGVLNIWEATTKDSGNRELVLLGGKGAETPAQASERLAGVAGELAGKIVEEVRARGPFLSLADFINRDLVAGEEGLRSAMQAAIDKCESPNEVNPRVYLNPYEGRLRNTGDLLISEYDTEAYLGGPLSDLSPSTTSSDIAYRNRYDQTAKVLTQADVLTTIGPVLSARSDTFVIRCYGEATNSANVRTAAAWCEAVIQRKQEYVDPADDATVLPGGLTREINKTLGRSLKIVSFRWLTADEI